MFFRACLELAWFCPLRRSLPDANIAADPKFSAAQADSNQILWLALTLTPGLGATRSRRLVEFFGTVDRVFSASLTELEASGLPLQSALALATVCRICE